MHEFDYESEPSLSHALERISESRMVFAGGTDLLTRLKAGIDKPSVLVDIKATELDSNVSADGDGLVLGALCTLSDIENGDTIDGRYALLKDAAGQAATQQIRNRATIAGNLMQAPRCWYYRHPDVMCWRKGGEECPAREGQNQHHAVVDSGPCVAVHPSDLATCLVALDASVDLRSREGHRCEKMADFLVAPTPSHRKETTLKPDEVITAVRIPGLTAGTRSCYLKAMDRKTWAFALCGVGAVIHRQDSKVNEARLCLSGVANTPLRLAEVESLLTGREASVELVEEAALLATERLTPLSENGYKVELVRGLVRTALERLLLSGD